MVETKKPTLEELRALAEKVDHDEFCGCASMADEPLNGVIECPLGALMKAFREFCEHEFKPDEFDPTIKVCAKCDKAIYPKEAEEPE